MGTRAYEGVQNLTLGSGSHSGMVRLLDGNDALEGPSISWLVSVVTLLLHKLHMYGISSDPRKGHLWHGPHYP